MSHIDPNRLREALDVLSEAQTHLSRAAESVRRAAEYADDPRARDADLKSAQHLECAVWTLARTVDEIGRHRFLLTGQR